MTDFIKFNKIARLSRDCIITEKIDGTNAQIYIDEDNNIMAGSRNRWLALDKDNFGFARWVNDNKEELLKLGKGRHFGEWWGSGIQRRYDMDEKVFSLFNTNVWNKDNIPKCCSVVPVLYDGLFTTDKIQAILDNLEVFGSKAAPGFMKPEGVVIWHIAAGIYFKKTIEGDEKPKGIK